MDTRQEEKANLLESLIAPAMEYANKGNYRKSINLLEKTAQNYRNNLDVYYTIQIQMAVILGQLKRDKEALDKFRSIPKYGDESIYLEAQRWLGDFFIHRKRWRDLENLYNELKNIELTPTVRIMLGRFLGEMKQYDEAIMLLNPISRSDGISYAIAKTNQMVLANRNKDYNKVIILSHMLSPNDDIELYGKSRLNLANALLKLGKKQEAFNVLISINKNQQEPRLYSEAQYMLWCKFPIKTLFHKIGIN